MEISDILKNVKTAEGLLLRPNAYFQRLFGHTVSIEKEALFLKGIVSKGFDEVFSFFFFYCFCLVSSNFVKNELSTNF